MLYLTSDLHFNHNREFIWGPRGFKSCKESNETLIRNWNNTITDEDTVIVDGDFFLGSDIEFVENTLKILKGKIILILGNHDTPAKIEVYKRCDKIIEICLAKQIEYKGRKFYISHYPTLTADLNSNPKTCVFNLFGHTHSKKKFLEDRPYMYNVAVDAHNNSPVSMDEIYNDIMNEIKKCISFLV